MKNQITHIVAIAVLGLVTFFAIPNRVQAAPAFKGQFTLTNDVVWNGTELPAGKYDFTLSFAIGGIVPPGMTAAAPAPADR